MSSKNNFYFTLQGMQKEVTGSCMLLKIHFPNNVEKNILIDCGLFQETKYLEENFKIPFEKINIDAIVITHSHIDHIGKLPILVKNGYNGPIFSTLLTRNVSKVLLENSAKINLSNYEKEKKTEKNPTPPLFIQEDVEDTMSLFRVFPYNQKQEILDNIFITFVDNGHLLSAASVYVEVKYKTETPLKILFTGDLKSKNHFKEVLDIPKDILHAHLNIVSECTLFEEEQKPDEIFKSEVLDAINKNKGLFIPCLAQERLEIVLLKLKELQKETNFDMQICVDSPLGYDIERIYRNYSTVDYLPKNCIFISSFEERQALLRNPKGKIIIASSGMGDFGNAPYYLQEVLDRFDYKVLFTSYLAANTLGRKIMETPKDSKVCIFEHQKAVIKRASCVQTREFSSHSSKDEVLEFISKFKHVRNVIINHGSFKSQEIFKDELNKMEIPAICISDNNFHKITNRGEVTTYSLLEEDTSKNECKNVRPSKKSKTNRTIPVFTRNTPIFAKF